MCLDRSDQVVLFLAIDRWMNLWDLKTSWCDFVLYTTLAWRTRHQEDPCQIRSPMQAKNLLPKGIIFWCLTQYWIEVQFTYRPCHSFLRMSMNTPVVLQYAQTTWPSRWNHEDHSHWQQDSTSKLLEKQAMVSLYCLGVFRCCTPYKKHLWDITSSRTKNRPNTVKRHNRWKSSEGIHRDESRGRN